MQDMKFHSPSHDKLRIDCVPPFIGGQFVDNIGRDGRSKLAKGKLALVSVDIEYLTFCSQTIDTPQARTPAPLLERFQRHTIGQWLGLDRPRPPAKPQIHDVMPVAMLTWNTLAPPQTPVVLATSDMTVEINMNS